MNSRLAMRLNRTRSNAMGKRLWMGLACLLLTTLSVAPPPAGAASPQIQSDTAGQVSSVFPPAASQGAMVIGKVPAASALLFDLGVFSLVVGATVLILIALAHQSVRMHRVRGLDAPKAEEN